jgi:hypothetical protein
MVGASTPAPTATATMWLGAAVPALGALAARMAL